MSPLRGRRVLSTRPAAQGQTLLALLTARGAIASELPLFRIAPAGDPLTQRAQLSTARSEATWIFTSANAARCAAAIDAGPWPALLAIGAATAGTLAELGHPGAQFPEVGSDSEALLALPTLRTPRGKRFLICTGVGGRALLETELVARGAQVERVELYRREPVDYAADVISRALRQLDALVCTSGESLERLRAITPDSAWPSLQSRLLVVPSPRVLELARRLGFTAVRAPVQTSDEALIACLEQGLAESAHHPK